MIYRLNIEDTQCNRCLHCQTTMPDLIHDIKGWSGILINSKNDDVNWVGITEAIRNCQSGALFLEEYSA